MSQFKLQLTEDEREVFAELFYNSDAHKVVFKVLDQLTALEEKAMLDRHIDASEQSTKLLLCDKLMIQGMHKLVRNLKALKTELNKR